MPNAHINTPSSLFANWFSAGIILGLVLVGGWMSQGVICAQEAQPVQESGEAPTDESDGNLLEQTKDKAEELAKTTQEKVDEIATKVNEDERAHDAKDSLLRPIYLLAERLAFPAFHWVAFAAMSAGVVSFALQLVLGKLAVLARSGFSLMEILSDGLGLFISVVGLVLTTQAATENSTFTENPFSVLSAAAVGLLFGLVFFSSGKRQELEALEARKSEKSSNDDQRR